ncbi:pyridoxal phosphate-dependent aminotransferase [Peptoniphilus sp. KCTC 25270]|uniref:pyridoxal phosphate-dependent aminotransferase n=1 Tax=Peptoniphilus sp. KCTC 25270 TaxID=2897414 RepID=UPI001E542C2A|nr:pyridoxal phosphate-dependent aminotransferase [Peptoniphilus sp. KCTC 25270]MCD1147725.1 pyridoxal phosphate-dependent aminotransferase [Peptoniphilus sp. KCTC 25270]
MKLSNRINELPYSAIRKLTPYANAAKAAGKKVYHLNIGAPDVETPQEFFDAINNLDMDVLGYAPTPGTQGLLEAMADYYKSKNIPLEAEDIIVTAGGSEALLFVLLAITDPGDEVLTCEPYYANYFTYFNETGTNIVTFPTVVENDFHLPEREVIESKITDKTRCILLSNPGNPTGAVYTKEEVYMIADIAKKHDLYILADEVYREFIFDGADYISFGSVEGIDDRMVILDSISKRYSACGARIGCVASRNKDLIAAVAKLATGRLAVPTLEMVGAEALYRMDEQYFKDVNEEYQKRRDCIYELLTNIEGVTTSKTAGAFYSIADLPVEDADDFCKWLLEEFEVDGETLMMAPAAGFYEHSEDYKSQVRIAFVLNCESLKKAMHILDEGLKAYNAR